MQKIQQKKSALHKACLLFVNNRFDTITNIIEGNKKALFSETKCSAGDKHETGRAMLQLEMEKAGQQLSSVIEMKETLHKIVLDKTTEIICLGNIIITNMANYYLAISAGKITIDNVDYFVISTNSPIGKQLLGKKVGDIIPFNNAEILEIF